MDDFLALRFWLPTSGSGPVGWGGRTSVWVGEGSENGRRSWDTLAGRESGNGVEIVNYALNHAKSSL